MSEGLSQEPLVLKCEVKKLFHCRANCELEEHQQALKELESAVFSSPLGLNPKADSQHLIAAIPLITS
ncbi:hypothetical protein F0562_004829 [Nyssa sinensis]|uniref:Uncharacterized protein n=1 Tax=Nyssa sinensis TaxID=561372 RepID=A0A5J5AHR5_9ASTE|nr:hypothetical protein F0562_004829 [Nyssa sinensis]